MEILAWLCVVVVGLAAMLVVAFLVWRWRRQPPGPPVPPGSALEWCCLPSIILSRQNFCPWNTLAFSTPKVCRKLVGPWWSCFSREDLLGALEDLVSAGHAAAFAETLHWAEAGRTPAGDWEARVLTEAKRIAASHQHIVAWDLCRAAFLVRAGHGAGWLSREEAEERLLDLGRRLQGQHRSWTDVFARYCDGRDFWIVYNRMDPKKVGDVRPDFEGLVGRKSSPLHTVEWNRPLGATRPHRPRG